MTSRVSENTELNNPAYYNNRELSWLAFNERVLEEAIDENNPLLERLKFLAIFSSNLDEFFMVRVAGLKDQVEAGYNKPENKAGLTPKQQLKHITNKNRELVHLQDDFFTETLMSLLHQERIEFLSIEEISTEQLTFLKNYFEEYIFPVLTPLAVDAYRPFPILLSKSINLAVLLEEANDVHNEQIAIVQVPSVLSRFIELPPLTSNKKQFIMLEHAISEFIGELFVGYKVKSVSPFRITRNADLTIHEEGARDLLVEIEKELKKRKWGAAVRLEYQKGLMDSKMLDYLTTELEIHQNDVYCLRGPLDLTFLFKLYNELMEQKEHLVNETFIPQPPEDLIGEMDIFSAMMKKDILLHHPYESFQPVIDFMTAAAKDPDVLAIKQTLYRVSGESPIVNALAEAAENGKQVTVLVELKARFDEENNIQWAKKLEKSGVHVIYGITSLKTHSKITLVVKQNQGRIQRFVHLGTGNYNDTTAKFYTDMGLLTSRQEFGEDATNFFNYLSGYRKKPVWNHISTSPLEIRDHLLEYIDQEIESHRKHGKGRIIAKMNSLTDKPLILKLYEASIAGVTIDLIVRGVCCLRPGIPDISENITVRSIVGRFLEHSRIYFFRNNGKEKIFLSSADWMTRNMEKRIEIMFPILDPFLKQRLKTILDITLHDNQKARIQDKSGKYNYLIPEADEPPHNSQLQLFERASLLIDHQDE
ncbi:RNA degradosome polyphosphate kinase [Salibacterium salarium]|uniref:Polyphosphate kinase n=1 Tax=Salibacterium salarium TaxID=284579 RepID=A0A3R9WPR1_9BACI|nr:RNA degradosome polyphosphate kinase [Salibacterium salarium]RSL30915.1 RNA degradosome polyphosphate kinase [Salibacterium salarium]